MNIAKLELKEYKNYKALTEILEEPIKSGKSKQLQLKDWERYFIYQKEGNKFIVTEIYDILKPKYDGRKDKTRQGNKGNNPNSHNTKQPNYPQVEILLSNYIRKKSNSTSVFYITKEYLALDIGLITKNFHNFSRNVSIYKSYLKENGKLQNALTLNIFKNNIENVYKKSVLDTALKHIQNDGGISYKYDYIMQIDVTEENKYNYIGCMLKDNEEQTNVIRVATDLENEIIKIVNDELIIKYKINQLNDLNYNKKKHIQFYMEQEKLIKERILKTSGETILRFWRGYEIEIYNSQKLKWIRSDEENKIIKELHEVIVEKQKERLNKQIKEMRIKLLSLQVKVDKSIQKCIDLTEIWGKPSTSMMEDFNNEARKPFKKEIDKYELYCSDIFKKQYIDILESLFLDYDLGLDGILKNQLEKIKKYNQQQKEKKQKKKETKIA